MVDNHNSNTEYGKILAKWRTANLRGDVPLADRIKILRKLISLEDRYGIKSDDARWISDLEEFEKARAFEIESILRRLGNTPDRYILTDIQTEIKEFRNKILAEQIRECLPTIQRIVRKEFILSDFIHCHHGMFRMGNKYRPETVAKKYKGGKPDNYQNAAPYHYVKITQDFYLAKFLVTRGDFSAFAAETGYHTTAEINGYSYGVCSDGKIGKSFGLNWRRPGLGFHQDDSHPVVHVSYIDAKRYIEWLNSIYRHDLPSGYKFDLPTEAQWEYACRGNMGAHNEFFWGDEEMDGRGKINAIGREHGPERLGMFPFNDGYLTTSPVGSFEPNDLGLYDMLGNVWEWCRDFYAKDYYNSSPECDPVGPPNSDTRVIRGGGFYSTVAQCRCAMRWGHRPMETVDQLGFRVAIVSKLYG